MWEDDDEAVADPDLMQEFRLFVAVPRESVRERDRVRKFRLSREEGVPSRYLVEALQGE